MNRVQRAKLKEKVAENKAALGKPDGVQVPSGGTVTIREEHPLLAFVVHPCGHAGSIPRHPKATDEQYIALVDKEASRKCKECRAADEAANQARAKARRAKKKKGTPSFRLPDGARYQAVYSAVSKTWKATLTVGDDYVAWMVNGSLKKAHDNLGCEYAEKFPDRVSREPEEKPCEN